MKIQKWLRIGIVAFAGIVVLGAAALAASYLGWGTCPPITATTKQRLRDYILGKTKLPPGAVLELAYAEPVGESCYQAVHFRIKDRGGPDLVAYLSPDQRFLSRDLVDWKLDAVLNPGRGGVSESPGVKLSDADFDKMMDGPFPSTGMADAQIKIALFTDFQCPYCKQEAHVLTNELKQMEARIVFHHLPLPNHPWARPAAEMASCVHRQSNRAFWDLFDALYRNQETLTPDNVGPFVRQTLRGKEGVDKTAFEACVGDHMSAAQVDGDMELARKHGVRATPTMFINGVRKEGVVKAEEIRRIAQTAAAGSPPDPQSAQKTPTNSKMGGSK